MVTRDAFEATVQRLDAKDEHLDAKVETGFKDIELKVSKGFMEVKDADRERNNKNRVFWTALVAMAGVLSGTVFGILGLIMK